MVSQYSMLPQTPGELPPRTIGELFNGNGVAAGVGGNPGHSRHSSGNSDGAVSPPAVVPGAVATSSSGSKDRRLC
ncbi:unnamed protein product [Ambrosiozyma monospora]|uniref:Unnamed protein product n=1 Tax=Ambrosiozyma monospora TaxID=43982 RepID=A0ACB5U0V7_AMBMO|nr:unnamed protein product [Ambrosiozyma monospora]